MYRGTMKQAIFFTLSLLFVSGALLGQNTPTVQSSSKITQEAAQQILNKYGSFRGAVLNMTKDEWDIIRNWDQYDDADARRIVKEWKEDHHQGSMSPANKAARMLAASGCECWVEPDDTYTQIETDDWDQTGGAGADVDCWLGPITLGGWSHNHYGELFNAFYINSKGTVSFGAGYIDWTPEEFPTATYDQIAGYWADIDIRATGEIWYKVTPEAVYVNFIDVGYYNNHSDKKNTFQIIFTPESSSVLPEGNNVQLCYLDMQWCHGDVGGSNGCSGPTPGTTGADKSSSTGPNIQYGRFGTCSDEYNGPYGNGNNEIDGVYWLSNKTFNFSTVGLQQNNIPPISTASVGCDTVTLCLSDTLFLDFEFLAPETNQQVTLDYSIDGFDTGLYINNIANGNTAIFDGGYVGSSDNIGFNTITITATDSGEPEAVTELNVVVEVIDVELPTLSIDGPLVICAGASTTLTASEGFDYYDWSSGCDTQECTISGGGQYTITASIEAGCSAEATITIDQTPYILPCIDIEPNPVCSDETAIVSVCEDELDDYVAYTWEADWLGLGGELVSDNGSSAEVTTGTYRLLVTQTDGCQGQRVFNVLSIDPFIPDDSWSGAYCDGLETVEFEGGYSNPAQGQLTIYLQSSDDNGWNGSFLNVYVNGELVEIFTSTSTFIIEQVAIEAGDDVMVEYISAGVGDENNDVLIYNCTNQNQIDPEPPFTNGQILYDGPAGCTAEPAYGNWNYVSGPGGDFSITDEFDTEFTPDGYGLHIIEFTESSCGIYYQYELEFTQEPAISLANDFFVLCGDEEAVVTAEIEDIGGTATIDWPSPGVDDVLSNTYSYDDPVNLSLTVTIENGCGEAEADFDIIATSLPAPPQLEDAILCDGGSVTLDPIPNDSPDLIYEWTVDGVVVGTDETFEVTETGEYCVNVSNQCDPVGANACADISIAAEINAPFGEGYPFCDTDGPYLVVADVPNLSWTVTWPDGSSGVTYEVSSNGIVCAQVTDPGNCATTEYCTNVFIGSAPNANPEPTELVTLCPEIDNVLSINADVAFDFTWTLNCDGGIALNGDDDLVINSSNLPPDCWGQILTVSATAANPCGSDNASFEVLIDPCEITIPNIFTPNGLPPNERFLVEGLDVYSDVNLYVYNRWGTLVYETADYENGDWDGADAPDGTYFYVLVLPNGREYTGTVNIAR